MIDLRLLGGTAVEIKGLEPTARVRQRNPLTLLALVARAAPRPMGRDAIAALMWPESDESRSRNSLRQTLFHIRKELGEETLLADASGSLYLDPARIRVDLWRFREALESNHLEEAFEAYGGPFLEGFVLPGGSELEHWADGVRSELRLSYIEVLDALGRRSQAAGRLDEAVRWRQRLAAANPLSSRAAVSLLTALTEAGDRSGAIQYGAVYAALVRDRLEVEPDSSVMEILERLKAAPEPGARSEATEPEVRSEAAALPTAAESPLRTPSVPADEDAQLDEPTPVAAAASAPNLPPVRVTAPVPVGASQAPSGTRASAVRWATIGAVFASVGFGVGQWAARDRPPAVGPGVPIVLASGSQVSEGRDAIVRLVSCEGPACPDEELPQPAHVVLRHAAYDVPVAGSNYISPIPTGTVGILPGFECCTEAVFELEFDLPEGVTAARIMLTSRADNRGTFWVNGTPMGQHTGDLGAQNFAGPHTTFLADFLPNMAGPNVLRVVLEDGGGAIAIQFHGVVTYETGN